MRSTCMRGESCNEELDACIPDSDAGSSDGGTPRDAGPLPDGGPAPDAGEGDAGASSDGGDTDGGPSDGSVITSDASTMMDDSGCSCGVGPNSNRRSLWALLLIGLCLALRRGRLRSASLR